MKVSEEIQARADKMSTLAEAIKYVEAQELNGQGRRLIHLLLVTYSDLTAAQCSVISGYSFPEAGRRAANTARRLTGSDWDMNKIWNEAVKIIHKKS